MKEARMNKRTIVEFGKSLCLILFTFPILLSACGKKETFQSKWRDREIKIDGQHEDWDGVMTYLEGQDVSVGVLNDEEFLYVCMVTRERSLRTKVTRLGLNLWFDPEGSTGKNFGIGFPVGMQGRGLPAFGRGAGRDFEIFRREFEQSLTYLEILGSDEEPKRFRVDAVAGIEARLSADRQMLVYELKVPLVADDEHPYAIGAGSADLIGIGLESRQLDLDALREQMGREGRSGGMGAPGGFGRQGPERGGRDVSKMLEQFKVWGKVSLADKQTTSDVSGESSEVQ